MQWIVLANGTLTEAGRQENLAMMMMPEGDDGNDDDDDTPEDEKQARKKKEEEKALANVGKAVAMKDRESLWEQGYSLADTHVWCLMRWLVFLQVDLSACGNVVGWMAESGGRGGRRWWRRLKG